VSIRLTESGWEARDKIVGLVFDTIAEIKADGLDRWRYQEQSQLAQLAFRFSEKREPMRTVSFLAGQMQEYPVEEAYSAGSIYEKFDRKLIKKYLGYLTPENLFLQETSPDVSADKISQHYQTPYAVASLKDVQWTSDEKLAKSLALPSKNRFIPSNLDLVAAKSSALPTKLTDSQAIDTWFQADPSFGVPKGRIKIRLKLPAATQGVESSVLMSLYTRMVKESLNSLSYPAFLAGLSYNIGGNSRGLDIEIGGYSDKQAELLAAINDTLTNTDTLMIEYDRVRTQLARNWRNNASQPPYTQLYGELSAVMFSPSWTIAERIAVIDTLDKKAMAKFIDGLYRGGEAEIMVYGNFDQDTAQRVQSLVANLIKQPGDITLAKAEVVKLAPGETHFWHSADHPDHALLGYLQGHNDTLEEQAKIRLLQQVVASDFFNSLRTEQQLGYVVTATRVQLKEVPALLTVVQSPTTSAAGLIQANHEFFKSLAMPTQEDFQRYKAAVLVELREKPKSMAEQASILWGNIAAGRDEFDLRQALAGEVEKLSLADFTAFYQSRVLEQSRWLWLAAGNEAAREASLDQIPAVATFKRDSEEYQYP
jgi:secreted Zn-dependent insulinase-like peptidase